MDIHPQLPTTVTSVPKSMITLLCREVLAVPLHSTFVRPNLLLDSGSWSDSSGSLPTVSSLLEIDISEESSAPCSMITLRSECPCSLIEHFVLLKRRDFFRFDFLIHFFPSDFFFSVDASRFFIIADSSSRISRPSLFHNVLHFNKTVLTSLSSMDCIRIWE